MTPPEDPRPQATGDQEQQEGPGEPAGQPATADQAEPAGQPEPAVRPRPAKELARASVARAPQVPPTGAPGAEPPAAAPLPESTLARADQPGDPAGASGGDDVAAASDPANAEVVGGAGGRRRRLGRWLVAAALVLLTATAGFLLYKVRAVQLDDQARQQALTAARQTAINVTSISTKDFATDVARVLDGSTGSFRQDFSARTGQLEQLLKDNDVSAQGRVLEAGVARSDRRTATALLVVDSTVKNKQVPAGRVNTYRMKIDMEKVGDRWLASSLEFVA